MTKNNSAKRPSTRRRNNPVTGAPLPSPFLPLASDPSSPDAPADSLFPDLDSTSASGSLIQTKVRNKHRITAVTTISEEADARRVFGAQELIRLLGTTPLTPGRSIHIISGGNIDLICHLRWLLRIYKRIDRVFISCWVIGSVDILLLKRWHEAGEIREIDLVLGNAFSKIYKREKEKIDEFLRDGIFHRVFQSGIHSKFILIETADGQAIVVESSANCNMNPRIEQSVVTLSRELYDFYRDYYDRLFGIENMKEQRLLLRTAPSKNSIP